MAETDSTTESKPTVTYRNTVKHWVLYTLDAIECDHENDDGNSAREVGVLPEDVYEYAGGDESIVFRAEQEVSQTLSELARLAPPYHNDRRPVNRRTDATEWDDGFDVEYRYRLTEFGRETLLDLGIPDALPNRRDYDEDDRELPEVQPSHAPDWWKEEDGFDADPDWVEEREQWIETDHPRVYYETEADVFDRGEDAIVADIAEAFPEATFVITMGPYRFHDIAYRIRDPFERVVQIDVYSPATMHRSRDEIEANVSMLVNDLHRAFQKVDEVDED